jgi:hypothetical protein
MNYFYAILQSTPLWVYLIFLSCVFLGIRSRKSRAISFQKLALLPFLFLSWSFGYLIEKYGISLSTMSVWLFAIGVGTIIGWRFHRPTQLTIDKQTKRITIPGTWAVLFLSILLFLSKYSFGYLHAIAEGAKDRLLIFGSDLFISGTISGIFLGKFFCFWSKIRESKT